jgi:D-proline reductase (dithiol) PrdB
MNSGTPGTLEAELAFAPDADQPIPYMQRTRDWYLALGYGNPYRWAHYVDVPFQPLAKPLAEATVALIITAAPYQPDKGNQGPGSALNAAAKFYAVYSGDTAIDHDLRNSHVAIDRMHTSMEDSGSWFPLPALRDCANSGRIRLAPRFHGAPTNRSQRHTTEIDCPEILRRCREDGADAALLVPNCPVCHQTVSLIARYLEAHGIASVIMACAKDIVEHVGVPRAMFSDFPLGNAAGKPHDKASQAATLELALRVLESAPGARTTVQSPQRWSADWQWKLDYSNVARLAPEEIARLRAEFDRGKDVAKAIRGAAEPGDTGNKNATAEVAQKEVGKRGRRGVN